MEFTTARNSDIDFISSGFSEIKTLPTIEGGPAYADPGWIASRLESRIDPLYQLKQFSIANINSHRVGFIQILDFALLKDHFRFHKALGLYDVNEEVLNFKKPLSIINSIYVCKDFRRRGIGRAMIEQVKNNRERSIGIFYSKYNSENIEFYLNSGFVKFIPDYNNIKRNQEIFLMVDEIASSD
ncbi:GNAT family N-acetyltransferase [Rhizobium sp. P38BS-XIX]|uniref:GNAT family N-acetyltransferase n=1 Tax=Rhizobium sp. P38BS-XIX TaxID=2726740 RepID=UPI001456C5A8|nr:GNAT family N-acetyltransferase [Rhizobium sp. P38BS-XIX]NLR98084.1 GNAT family N-acetyltransferase [Rhizobium sp. P38BS-XIX]